MVAKAEKKKKYSEQLEEKKRIKWKSKRGIFIERTVQLFIVFLLEYNNIVPFRSTKL